MRVAWSTDTHLDFLSVAERDDFCDEVLAHAPDRLVLTGDIADARSFAPILARIADRIAAPVDFVLGNHDYYGSDVASVREQARALGGRVRWAHGREPLALTPHTALVGVDGWGDARLGAFDSTPVVLNDFLRIGDLAGLAIPRRNVALRALGDESARSLDAPLRDALARFEDVLVLTHVPPFREACWHEGAVSNDDWLPYFTCKAVGDVLLAAARDFSHRTLTVLCGHTHSAGVTTPAPNLTVHTGSAAYGDPSVKATLSLR